jgi:hypothetical protein
MPPSPQARVAHELADKRGSAPLRCGIFARGILSIVVIASDAVLIIRIKKKRED